MGKQPTCPKDCFEREDTMFGEPAIVFIRKRDGHCVGYRRPIVHLFKDWGKDASNLCGSHGGSQVTRARAHKHAGSVCEDCLGAMDPGQRMLMMGT